MLNTLKPILDRVVVICEPSEEVSAGGVILIDSGRESHLHPTRNAMVVAVGPGNVDSQGNIVEMTVKVGDRIQFSGVAGVSISGKQGKASGQEETLITEADIYFIYEETNNV